MRRDKGAVGGIGLMAGCRQLRRDRRSVHALCKAVAGEHRPCLGTGDGPAKSLWVRLRG